MNQPIHPDTQKSDSDKAELGDEQLAKVAGGSATDPSEGSTASTVSVASMTDQVGKHPFTNATAAPCTSTEDQNAAGGTASGGSSSGGTAAG